MKKTIIIILSLAAAALASMSCDGYYDGYYDSAYYETSTDFLTLRNFSSDTTVWFIPSKENSVTLPSEITEWQGISIYEIAPHSSTTLSYDSDDSYVTPVETYGVDDKMVIYVFKKNVWRTHQWSELVSGKMWCGTGSYAVDDLVALKKIVTYPMQ